MQNSKRQQTDVTIRENKWQKQKYCFTFLGDRGSKECWIYLSTQASISTSFPRTWKIKHSSGKPNTGALAKQKVQLREKQWQNRRHRLGDTCSHDVHEVWRSDASWTEDGLVQGVCCLETQLLSLDSKGLMTLQIWKQRTRGVLNIAGGTLG